MDKKMAKISLGSTNYKTLVKVGGHEIIADEPADLGGGDEGATATHLLLASLGACTAATLRMYAERKGWEVGEINIAMDIEQENRNGTMHSQISRKITFGTEISTEQHQRMMIIADKCPIHKTLMGEMVIETR